MNNSELSARFDILYNNISSNQAPGLNGYEKSVFFTMAEKQLLRDYFSSKTDALGGFDGSEKRQYDFSSIIKNTTLHCVTMFEDRLSDAEKLDSRSIVYLLPEDCYLIINEILNDSASQYSVIPIHYTEYQRQMAKPYNYPAKRTAWRLITDKKVCNVFYEALKDAKGNDTSQYFNFLSSWADPGKHLKVNIKTHPSFENPTRDYDYNDLQYYGDGLNLWAKLDSDVFGVTQAHITTSCRWINNIYNIDLVVDTNAKSRTTDKQIFNILKYVYNKINALQDPHYNLEEEFGDVMRCLDGFASTSAPSTQKCMVTETNPNGYTFETTPTDLPMVEIIGMFKDKIPAYHLHYVMKPSPIILEDLSVYGEDISIDGKTEVTECQLPSETHEEIVERAVALAKIAWQGGVSGTTSN